MHQFFQVYVHTGTIHLIQITIQLLQLQLLFLNKTLPTKL